MKLTSAFLMILLGALASGPALARGGQSQSFGRSGSPMFHGSHFHSSVHSGFVVAHNGRFHPHFRSRVVIIVGAPFFAPFYYPAPYYYSPYPYPYYYPPVVTVPASPPTYIEQGGGGQAAPTQSQAYWYYCTDAKAYYPYVKDCPGGWQRVAPQPPPGP